MTSLPTATTSAIGDHFEYGAFTSEAWQRTARVREAIDALPFLRQLADATLPDLTFRNYLTQDAIYLADYSRVLAAAASQAQDSDQIVFWAESAHGAISVERQLHLRYVRDFSEAESSPTTVAYTSYLLSLAAAGNYPVLAAAILPCFWIYDDVGTRLKAAVPDLDAHLYGDWIGTYGDPDFTAATATARDIVDRLATQADPHTVDRMHAAFYRASQYEWMFWDAADRHETWPI